MNAHEPAHKPAHRDGRCANPDDIVQVTEREHRNSTGFRKAMEQLVADAEQFADEAAVDFMDNRPDPVIPALLVQQELDRWK